MVQDGRLIAAQYADGPGLHINSGKMVQMVQDYKLTAAKWCRWFRITN